ncbi:MAG TPA: YhfC family glutamic-type intramembrane protease, partial [Ktedonobacteraceae bacterium]
MPATVHVNPLNLAALIVATIFVIAYPIVLAIIARKRLHVGWRYFWFGVLIFLIFQLATRVPAVAFLQGIVLAPLLRASKTFTWIWLVILVLTAGIFEEVGRYVAYRFFMKREAKTWN